MLDVILTKLYEVCLQGGRGATRADGGNGFSEQEAGGADGEAATADPEVGRQYSQHVLPPLCEGGFQSRYACPLPLQRGRQQRHEVEGGTLCTLILKETAHICHYHIPNSR